MDKRNLKQTFFLKEGVTFDERIVASSFFFFFFFFNGLHNRSRVSVHLASSRAREEINRWFKLDQGGREIIYNKDSPLLLRRIEAGLVASRGLLGSSVLGSLFTLKWKHLLCIQSNRARGMGVGRVVEIG